MVRRQLLRVLVVLGLLAGASFVAPASAGPTPTQLLVGFEGPVDTLLLKLLGATVLRTFSEINVAQVSTLDPLGLTSALLGLSKISFVEANGALRTAGSWSGLAYDASGWDASSWDASGWDASSWDASGWDASSWDASGWDASSWDASDWDASSWDASAWGAKKDTAFGVQWGLGAAHFPQAWTRTHGSGATTICVLDTGIQSDHPDLAAHVAGAYDARLNGRDPSDDVGHGTHVAGIVTAIGGNARGIAGATDDRVMSVKVMGASGGTEADLAQGLLTCAKRSTRIASLSLHIDAPSPTVERAIKNVQSRGMLVVASSGNGGTQNVKYPAAYGGVIAVGAVEPDGDRAPFTDAGPRLDILAPGVKIASTMKGGSYAIGSGTSQAAPFVSAAAALVWDLAPTKSASDVRATILASARDLGSAGRALDAGAAVGVAR